MKISEVIKNKKIWAIATILIAVAAVSIFYFEERTKDERVRASGTVEVTELNLSPLAGGRILELNINESDHVNKGQLIARMSLDGADHDVEMAEASLASSKEQLLELQN